MIKYIKSLDRVGCDPFAFISEKDLINKYKNTSFKLVKNLTPDTKRVKWGEIRDLIPCHGMDRKIDRKIKDKKLNLYYKNVVYNKVTRNPVVISHDGHIIDGHHRLKNIKTNKLCFNAWIATGHK